MPNLNGGMSALARVLGGGGEQQAYYQQAQMLGRMGLMQSQMRDNDAGVDLKRAQAAKVAQEAAQAQTQFDALQNPELAESLIASMGLSATDPVQAARANELRGLVGLSRVLGKSSDFENLAKGLGVTQGTAQSGIAPQVAATNPEQAAWLLSSASGKGAPKIYDDMPMGTYNTLTGKRDYDQGLYQADLGLTGAKTGQANAAASASKASAASSYANAALSKARIGEVGLPTWDAERGILVDRRSGSAQPVMLNGAPLPGKQSGAPTGYRWTENGVQLEPIAGGPADPATKANTGKPLPTSAAEKLMSNRQNMRRAEQALGLINGETVGGQKGSKDATGLKGYLPDAIVARTDPGGVATRAAIADLGSLVIHDRSGAALTAAEYPRLAPFIPKASDDPQTVRTKLQRFNQVYKETVADAEAFYKESGYNVPADPAARGASGEWQDAGETKSIGGKSYVKRDGKWYEQ